MMRALKLSAIYAGMFAAAWVGMLLLLMALAHVALVIEGQKPLSALVVLSLLCYGSGKLLFYLQTLELSIGTDKP